MHGCVGVSLHFHPFMKKLCTFGGATIAGYVGWYLAAACGAEFFGAFIWSGVASVVGVYVGWKLAQKWE